MESCMVARMFRFREMRERNGNVYTTRGRVDGPMSCSCEDDDDEGNRPTCEGNCVKVLVIIGVIVGSAVWVCLTATPPPVPI